MIRLGLVLLQCASLPWAGYAWCRQIWLGGVESDGLTLEGET